MWFRHSRAQASVTKAREDVLAMFVADNEMATASHPGVGAFQRRGGLMRGSDHVVIASLDGRADIA